MTGSHSWRIGLYCALGAMACGSESMTAPQTVTLSDPAGVTAQAHAVSTPFSTPMYLNYAFLSGKFSGPIYTVSGPQPPQSPRAIPPGILGTTYVWDLDSARYVASTLAGAPSNGIRFIIYSTLLTPVVPLDPVGYVDFTDRGTASALSIGVTLVGTGGTTPVTYADITISGPRGKPDSLSGYLSDGATRLDIVSTRRSGPAVLQTVEATSIVIPSSGARMTFGRHSSVTSSAQGDTITITYLDNHAITIGSETLAEQGDLVTMASGGTGTQTGSVAATVNGRPFATRQVGSPDGWVAAAAAGAPLTAESQIALGALYGAPNILFFELLGFFARAGTMDWRGY